MKAARSASSRRASSPTSPTADAGDVAPVLPGTDGPQDDADRERELRRAWRGAPPACSPRGWRRRGSAAASGPSPPPLLPEAVPLLDGDVAQRERQDLALLEVEVVEQRGGEAVDGGRRARVRAPRSVPAPTRRGAARPARCGPRRPRAAPASSPRARSTAPPARAAPATGRGPRRCGGGAGRRGRVAARRRAWPARVVSPSPTSRTRRGRRASSRRKARWMMTISWTHGRSVVGVVLNAVVLMVALSVRCRLDATSLLRRRCRPHPRAPTLLPRSSRASPLIPRCPTSAAHRVVVALT